MFTDLVQGGELFDYIVDMVGIFVNTVWSVSLALINATCLGVIRAPFRRRTPANSCEKCALGSNTSTRSASGTKNSAELFVGRFQLITNYPNVCCQPSRYQTGECATHQSID